MKLGEEDLNQIQLFDWIRSRPDIEPYAWHVANERKCDPIQGRLLKRKGVKAGISDNFVNIARKGYHGLIIELKSKNGKLSIEQERFQANMIHQGYHAIVCWSFEEARAAILEYLDETPSS
jgi:hypothetical protein